MNVHVESARKHTAIRIRTLGHVKLQSVAVIFSRHRFFAVIRRLDGVTLTVLVKVSFFVKDPLIFRRNLIETFLFDVDFALWRHIHRTL